MGEEPSSMPSTDDRPLYLDHHATTPLSPQVLSIMMPFLTDEFGNPSSRHHRYGQRAHEAVETAREQVANAINCDKDEIYFTSGATESNNIALRGCMLANRAKGSHLITAATEHKAVLEVAQQLATEGFDVTVLPVSTDGILSLESVRSALLPTTVMVSVMFANNEIGTIQDVSSIGSLCRSADVFFHTDATQALTKIPIDVQKQSIDLLSLSAHKIGGPKGIGALFVRRRKPRVRVSPLVFGGSHERGLRSGTINCPAVVGLGAACELGGEDMQSRQASLRSCRDELWARVQKAIPGVVLNGALEPRLAGNLNFRLPEVDAEALIYRLKRIAISSGAACTSTRIDPSHVLTALGLTERQALSSLRIGLGQPLCSEQVELVVEELATAYAELKSFIAY